MLSGQGWSVVTRGEFLLLRAMPVLTGGGIAEVTLTEAQMRALRDGDVTVEELLMRDAATGRHGQTQVSLSDAAQRAALGAAQAGLIADPAARGRGVRGRAKSGGTSGAASGGRGPRPAPYDHRLTAAALVLAAGVLIFIFFWS